jgi:adenylate kinase
MMMNLVILGSPGSGKGTQAHMLAQKHSLLWISTGDILRNAVAEGTELGLKAKNFMDSGDLVPDELVIDLIRETLETKEKKEGFILDGFPRTLNQAKALGILLDKTGDLIDSVIYLDVSKEEVVRRLSVRRTCPECNRLYNLATDPPADGSHCDNCSCDLIVRSDDQEDVILNRLEVYREETLPILEWYESRSKVCSVNGEIEPSEVFVEINQFLGR